MREEGGGRRDQSWRVLPHHPCRQSLPRAGGTPGQPRGARHGPSPWSSLGVHMGAAEYNGPRSPELSLKATSPRGGSGEVAWVARLGPAATAGLGTVAVPVTTAARAG